MSSVNDVIKLIVGAPDKYKDMREYNLGDSNIAAQVTYFDQNEAMFLPHVQEIVSSIQPKELNGLKIYCVDARPDKIYRGVSYNSKAIMIDDTGKRNIDFRKTKEFADFIHDEYQCAYIYNNITAVNAIRNVMAEAHEMAKEFQSKAYDISYGIHEVIGSTVMTVKAGGSVHTSKLQIGELSRPYYTVSLMDNCVVDPITHNKVLKFYEWLDYMFSQNDTLSVYQTLTEITDVAFINDGDKVLMNVLNSMFCDAGLSREEWAAIKLTI